MSPEALRVLTWPDYAIGEVEELFSKSTGLPVEWDFFDQNEEAYRRCWADPNRYDVVFADGGWPRRYLESGLIQPINTTVAAGWPDVHPVIGQWCTQRWAEPGGGLSTFPCFWGISGIIYDRAHVERPTSWLDLLSALPRTLWLTSQGSEVMAEIALGMGVNRSAVYAMSARELEGVTAVLHDMIPCMCCVWRLLPELETAFQLGARSIPLACSTTSSGHRADSCESLSLRRERLPTLTGP